MVLTTRNTLIQVNNPEKAKIRGMGKDIPGTTTQE